MSSSSTSTPKTPKTSQAAANTKASASSGATAQHPPEHPYGPDCEHCGHPRASNALECTHCGHVFAGRYPRGVFWLQLALFLLVLCIALYPYIKRAVPAIEQLLEPSVYAQRLGDMAFRKQAWKPALAHYTKASHTRGLHTYVLTKGYQRRQALMHYKMAICAMRLSQPDGAASYAETARQKAPQWMLPYELLAQLHAHKANKAKFVAIATQLTQQFAKHTNAWLIAGNGYSQLGMHKQALAAYQAGLQRQPEDIPLLTNMAWELMRRPHRTKATLTQALKAAELASQKAEGSDFIALDTFARALWLNGQRTKAIQQQRIALQRAQTLRHTMERKSPQSLRKQSLLLAISRMNKRLTSMLTPPQPTSPPQAPRPIVRPIAPSIAASQATSQPISQATSQPTSAPIVQPLPRIFQHPTPVPPDPRHTRSRRLLLPE